MANLDTTPRKPRPWISPTLARIVGRCQALPGQELFAYVDDNGTTRDVGSQTSTNICVRSQQTIA
jgi:DNA topoisomerase IB